MGEAQGRVRLQKAVGIVVNQQHIGLPGHGHQGFAAGQRHGAAQGVVQGRHEVHGADGVATAQVGQRVGAHSVGIAGAGHHGNVELRGQPQKPVVGERVHGHGLARQPGRQRHHGQPMMPAAAQLHPVGADGVAGARKPVGGLLAVGGVAAGRGHPQVVGSFGQGRQRRPKLRMLRRQHRVIEP